MVTVSGQAGRRHASATWRVPRGRGATSGVLLVLLGIWGGLIPFLGPQFHYAYSPNTSWTMTWGRLWLEVLPSAAAVIGGFILLSSTSRLAGLWAGWLASLGGAWFVVGPSLSQLWSGGQPQSGSPVATDIVGSTVEAIGFFYGVGAVMLFLGALALGRHSVIGIKEATAATAAATTTATTMPPEAPMATDRPDRSDQPTMHQPPVSERVERRDPETGA